jgi:hypothetical protein
MSPAATRIQACREHLGREPKARLELGETPAAAK